jgi:iron complex transport system substrate-binding protein
MPGKGSDYISGMRIASLLASGTELVCALGAGPELVGRSHECDHPPWVRSLPVLSHPTFDVSGSSGEIDRLVRQKLRAGEPLYRVDESALAALEPDVIITQTHCQVCAVGPEALKGQSAAVLLHDGTIEGVLRGFGEVAALIGRRAEGEALVAAARARLQRWREATAALPRPRVVCLEWLDPPFAMGNWGPELVRAAGGEDALGTPGAHSRATTWEAVRAARPDVLIIAPCGFGLERTLAELPDLSWAQSAYAADGNLYFNRSSPTLFETVDLLAEILHGFPPRLQAFWRTIKAPARPRTSGASTSR